MMLTTVARLSFLASLPERAFRTLAAAVGGVLHETFQLALPRVVRRSRFYEATARNLLRVTIELVGGVDVGDTVWFGTEEDRKVVVAVQAKG